MTPASSQDEQTTVTLTLLLDGGHREQVTTRLDDPGLQTLLQRLTADDGHRHRLQIPVNGGESLLCIHSDRVVGFTTTPPLQLQSPVPPAMSAGANDADTGVEPARILMHDDFLPADVHRALLDYAIAEQSRYVETSTATRDRDYRQSVVLHEFPPFADLFRQRLRAMLPQITAELGCAALAQTIEVQLTAHNDGHYYKVHNDNGSPDTATRELTFVYYFHRQPRAFGGGTLRVFDTVVRDGYYVAADSDRLVEPADNRIVFFLSRYQHEVLPIRCPSRRFEDGRFTVNGWLHRQA